MVPGGDSGCYFYGAQYSLKGFSIRIQDTLSTETYCTDPEGIMDPESVYTSILAEVRNWEVDNTRKE